MFEAKSCWASSSGFSHIECGKEEEKGKSKTTACKDVPVAHVFSLKFSPLSNNSAKLLF